MLYVDEHVPELYRPHVALGRAERARVLSGLLADAAVGTSAAIRRGASGLARLGRKVVSDQVRAHRRRVAIRQLEALDDRLLKDIGISRAHIPAVVEGKSAVRGAERMEPSPRERVTLLLHLRKGARSARQPERRAA